MSGALKKTTLLTGLPVCKIPRETLTKLYTKLLIALNRLPETSAYRINTQVIAKERAEIVKTTIDVNEIEKKINCGQVEELIVQVENEILLARKMVAWKAWEPLVEEPPKSQWTWPPHK